MDALVHTCCLRGGHNDGSGRAGLPWAVGVIICFQVDRVERVFPCVIIGCRVERDKRAFFWAVDAIWCTVGFSQALKQAGGSGTVWDADAEFFTAVRARSNPFFQELFFEVPAWFSPGRLCTTSRSLKSVTVCSTLA